MLGHRSGLTRAKHYLGTALQRACPLRRSIAVLGVLRFRTVVLCRADPASRPTAHGLLAHHPFLRVEEGTMANPAHIASFMEAAMRWHGTVEARVSCQLLSVKGRPA
jgi:hypothetical protein